MTDLIENIYTIASSVSGLSVYYSEAPQDNDETAVVSYPYCTFEILASNKERDTGTQWRLAKVQFNLFGQSDTDLDTLTDSLDAELRDEANYSFSDFSLMDLFEDFRTGAFSVDSDDNKYLWQISVQYTYKLEEI